MPPRSRRGGSRSCSTAAAAIETALADAAPGDVVVIAGKGADTEMEIATGNVAFDDREVARELLSS